MLGAELACELEACELTMGIASATREEAEKGNCGLCEFTRLGLAGIGGA